MTHMWEDGGMTNTEQTPRIVTPQEEQANPTGEIHWCEDCQEDHALDLVAAYRLRVERDGLVAACKMLRDRSATEPERITAAERAAVVKVLDDLIEQMRYEPDSLFINERKNAIENGAPL